MKVKRQNSFPSLSLPPSPNRCEKLSRNVYIGTHIPYDVCLSLLLSPWPEQLGEGGKGLLGFHVPVLVYPWGKSGQELKQRHGGVLLTSLLPVAILCLSVGWALTHQSSIKKIRYIDLLTDQSDTGIFSMPNFLFPDVPSFCQVDKSKQKTHHHQQPGQGPNIGQENFPGPSCRRVQLEPATLKAVVPRLSQMEDTSWVYPWEWSLPRIPY